MSAIELVGAHAWRRVTFTTYALSLAFFEAVVLDALVRGGGREATILSDVEGVRAALSELGARRAGRDYEVEPVKVARGVFHPKLSVLEGEDTHLLIGSGNLTFSGWGGNLECIEHLHPSFASDAFDDAAEFFELMAIADTVTHAVPDRCWALGERLRQAALTGPRTGNIRLVHGLDRGIGDQLVDFATELGGAKRLVMAAPYWDEGQAVDRLCQGLGLSEAFIHAHDGGAVEGKFGSNWPRNSASPISAVTIEEFTEKKPRPLHAKCIEILCERGRLIVSGSANGTTAALTGGRNVEACVVRVQRDRLIGWTLSPAMPLDGVLLTPADEAEAEAKNAVIRAVLTADRIEGQILASGFKGECEVFRITALGPQRLGSTNVAGDGLFSVDAPGLEIDSLKGGRLIMRVVHQNGRVAEGFVSVSAFFEIARRAGATANRFFALLAGAETPDDVAAIISWLQEDPARLTTFGDGMASGAGGGPTKEFSEATISYVELKLAAEMAQSVAPQTLAPSRGGSRLLSQILAALREPRGAFAETSEHRLSDDEEDGDAPSPLPSSPVAKLEKRRYLDGFEKLFDSLTTAHNGRPYLSIAFALTLYMIERFEPEADRVQHWLDKLLDIATSEAVAPELRSDLFATALLLIGDVADAGKVKRARSRLIKIGADLNDPAPDVSHLGSAMRALGCEDLETRLEAVRKARTQEEIIALFVHALKVGQSSVALDELKASAPAEWPVLQDAITNERSRRRLVFVAGPITACPLCNTRLPVGDQRQLQHARIASASNCCGSVLIWASEP